MQLWTSSERRKAICVTDLRHSGILTALWKSGSLNKTSKVRIQTTLSNGLVMLEIFILLKWTLQFEWSGLQSITLQLFNKPINVFVYVYSI